MKTSYNESRVLEMLADPQTSRTAFALVVNEYSETLYWKIRRIVVNHDDANDVLQNVFLKAWKNLNDFRCESKLSTWLYRIAVNESLDFLRKQKNSTLLDSSNDNILVNKLMADEYFDGDELQARLQVAISRLPDVQRIVFIMRYFDEKKYSEISAALGTSEGALKASYHLAVKKITDFFKTHD